MRFRDRSEAGLMLAGALKRYKNRPNVLVLALPRGGVPVGYQVATALNAVLDLFIVRKLGVPSHEELAMGAIASGGIVVLNRSIIQQLTISQSTVDQVAAAEAEEVRRRELLYRGHRTPPNVSGQIVILVDDGLATGATMKAAVAALREQNPERIVVAVPLGPGETCDELRIMADEVICLITPEPFYGVGYWYENFQQTTDDEVAALIRRAAQELPS